ncbi:hypothetical protein OKHIL_76760 [Mycolicibacterium mageritense]|nr:hypothetical protein MTY414_77450 [Mycolicibacterium mageritense]
MLARTVDELLVGVVTVIIGVVSGMSSDLGIMHNLVVGNIVIAALSVIYFVVFDVTKGRTIGKMLFKLSVRGPRGAYKPTAKQSAIRNSFYFIQALPVAGTILKLIAYLVIGVSIHRSPTKQGVHDRLAGGTQVVMG